MRVAGESEVSRAACSLRSDRLCSSEDTCSDRRCRCSRSWASPSGIRRLLPLPPELRWRDHSECAPSASIRLASQVLRSFSKMRMLARTLSTWFLQTSAWSHS